MHQRAAERKVERTTLGAMLILLGIHMLVRFPGGLFMLIAGAILLGSALYQRGHGWPVSKATWFFGWLGAGLGSLYLLGVTIKLLAHTWPLLFIAIGLFMLLRQRKLSTSEG